MRVLVWPLVAAGLLASAPAALAQPSGAIPVDSVTPSFALMDVDGDHSQLEAEAGMGFVTDHGSGELWTGRLRAQVMLSPAFGLYATLQGGAISGGSDSDAGLGNPELGGVVHLRTGATTDIGLHAGAVFSLTDPDGLGSIAGMAMRPSDLPLVATGTTWLRAGASATYHDHAVFARVDLGIDQAVDPETDTFGHVNAGFGLGNPQWSATAELQVLFGSHDADAETAGLSLRYHGTTASPYLAIASPIGGDLFKDVILLSAGASFAL